MFARYHGETPKTVTVIRDGRMFNAIRKPASNGMGTMSAQVAVEEYPDEDDIAQAPPFGYMFGALADDPANRLADGADTIAALHELGAAIADDPSNDEGVIPAAYTYFGQFIDHDVSKTVLAAALAQPGGMDIIELADFAPLTRAQVESLVSNARTAPLDLDNLYGGLAESDATNADGSMVLGKVTAVPPNLRPITTADRLHDLPRRPRIANPQTLDEQERDRQALIGDPRNDENLLVGQLHVAFLRAHNALMARDGLDRAAAQTAMRRRYQWAVLHDFLPRICDPTVINDILDNGPSVLTVATPEELFIPVEFSGAAYRFGHSMVRQEYEHNSTFNSKPGALAPGSFNFMFTFTALSGDLSPGAGPGGSDTFPDNWIIEWHRYLDGEGLENPSRRIDTRIAPELGRLPDFQGKVFGKLMEKLATRNLLRGYLLGLPTGQAVATALGVPVLAPAVLTAAVPASAAQAFADAGFDTRTPLWFYLLAEAGDPAGANGLHLGATGSRIVAETFWNLAKHASDSVIDTPPSAADIATGEFSLRGIVKLGLDGLQQPL